MTKEYFLRDHTRDDKFPFYMELTAVEHDFDMHSHDFSELVIILEGSAGHIVDGQKFDIASGDVFVIHSGCSHCFGNARALKLYNIMYDARLLTAEHYELKAMAGFQALFVLEPFYRKEHDFKSRLVLDPASQSYVKGALQVMLAEYKSKKQDSEAVLKAYFFSLIAYLSRQYQRERNPYSEKIYIFAESVAYIENNYTGKIDTRGLAERANLSSRQFIRTFKYNYGMTPTEYIIRLRIKKACELLCSTDMDITRVAMESGFSEASFFTRQFKERKGLPPREYRRTMRFS